MDRPFVTKLRINKRYRPAKNLADFYKHMRVRGKPDPFTVEDYVPVSTPSPQSTVTNETTDAASTIPMLSQLTKGMKKEINLIHEEQYCGATGVKEEIPEYTADNETGSTTRREKHCHNKREKNHTKSTQMTEEEIDDLSSDNESSEGQPTIKKPDPYLRPRLPTIFPQCRWH
ncbi:hypothetical protein HA402_013088 [Bradysia odoriphaga]|nr:hypothetical protein HA402_013088 [Bradysia odoriphaga]